MTMFRWWSLLGVSVALFLLYGGFQMFIGLMTPAMWDSEAARRAPIGSEESDRRVFGDAPSRLWDSDPAYRNLWRVTVHVIAGLLVASGALTMAVAWFALRGGEVWALASLAFVGVVVLPFWWLAFAPYREGGVAIQLFGGIPPFMLVPATLLLPAIVAGLLGLRGG